MTFRVKRTEYIEAPVTAAVIAGNVEKIFFPDCPNLRKRPVLGLTIAHNYESDKTLSGVTNLNAADLSKCYLTLYCRAANGAWGEHIKDLPLYKLSTVAEIKDNDGAQAIGHTVAPFSGWQGNVYEFEAPLLIDFSKSYIRKPSAAPAFIGPCGIQIIAFN